jgi:hypothetical protein
MVRRAAGMGERRNACKILARKPDAKRRRNRHDDNSK